jgi:general secretion pathway protein J
MSRNKAQGFTLLELLVAMFIAAIMFAMGYGALNQALNSRDSVKEHQARLTELQTAMRVMEQDLVQLEPRPIRAPVGYSWLPALQGSPVSQPVAQFTRGGWNNPAGLQRPGLQRVAYLLEDGTLKREYWNVLDPPQASPTVKRDLLTHVKSITLRYMDSSHQWQTQWPATTVAGGFAAEVSLRSRPIAIELTLDTEDWGTIVRVLEIPG